MGIYSIMASITIHKQHIREHLQELDDAVAIGLERRPATIGLHTSACSIELLELYLHITGKITTGTVLKHEWFKAPKPGQKIAPLAERKLGFDFPHKNDVLSLLYVIEEERNKLIYGKSNKASIETVLRTFNKLHLLIKEKLQEKGEDID